jgi:hypothetical protein
LSDQVFVDRQLAPLPAANSNRTQIVQAACGNSLTSSAPAFAQLATAQAATAQVCHWSAAHREQQAEVCTNYPGPGLIAGEQ